MYLSVFFRDPITGLISSRPEVVKGSHCTITIPISRHEAIHILSTKAWMASQIRLWDAAPDPGRHDFTSWFEMLLEMVTHVLQDRLMDMAAATTRNQGNRAATLIRRLYTMVFNICNLDPKGYLQAQPGYVKGQHHETAVEHKQNNRRRQKWNSFQNRELSAHTLSSTPDHGDGTTSVGWHTCLTTRAHQE